MSEKLPFSFCDKADILSSDQKSEIYTAAEVRLSKPNKVGVITPPHVLTKDVPDYYIRFYDAIKGLVNCRCKLSYLRDLPDGRQSWRCSIQEDFGNQQRHNDVRAMVELKATATISITNKTQSSSFKVTILNISMGGLFFRTHELLDDEMSVVLAIDEEELTMKATVVVLRRRQLEPIGGCMFYGYGCRMTQFKGITDTKLRKYIFDKDSELRKKIAI